MGKFNLKKILTTDYEVDLVQATNFEQWVGKNLDYEAVMEKNFKDISFKSSETNKKDFLKKLKEKAIKLDPTESVLAILELFEDDYQNTKVAKLYENIRKLDLEIFDKNAIIDNQKKKINDLTQSKMSNHILLECQSKIISEYNSFLRTFDLGFDINEYEKIIGNLSYRRMENLKNILVESGLTEEKTDSILLSWREKQNSEFNDAIEVNVDFKNYVQKRGELRDQFNFIKENSDFLDAVMKIKNIEVVFGKKELSKPEGWIANNKKLTDLGKVFISEIISGISYKTGWINATKKVFKTNRREEIFKASGVNFETLDVGNGKILTVYDSQEKLIEKINKKAFRLLWVDEDK